MAKQRSLDQAIAAIYQVLAEGITGYPDDEKALRNAVSILQKQQGRI